MDIVNSVDQVIPKMREQMNIRKIHSLDVIYRAIEKEPENFNIKNLDLFLGKFGIYLKSQEVTTILNYCSSGKDSINLAKFSYLFRTKVPEDIIKMLNKIFDVISDEQAQMDVEELLQHLDAKEHPQQHCFKQNLERIKESVLEGLRIILGDKKIILREEFLEFHYNIFWALPEYCFDNFRKQVPLMWGLKKLVY